MTSFLALRASVCAYLWCLIPPVFIITVCYIGARRHPLILFFLTWAGPILLQVPPRFDPAFSGSRLVRVSFSSWEKGRKVICDL